MFIIAVASALFLVFLICGIYTSVASVVQGVDRFRWPNGTAKNGSGDFVEGTRCHRPDYVDEVSKAFSLYQTGALTKEEFEQLKRHLFATLDVAAKSRI